MTFAIDRRSSYYDREASYNKPFNKFNNITTAGTHVPQVTPTSKSLTSVKRPNNYCTHCKMVGNSLERCWKVHEHTRF